jgi:hypothetical protein
MMERVMKAIRTSYENWVCEQVMCEGRSYRQWWVFIFPVSFVLQSVKLWYRRLVCKMFGHRWEDTSWCTPDSGGDGQWCSRCGDGWSHTYY